MYDYTLCSWSHVYVFQCKAESAPDCKYIRPFRCDDDPPIDLRLASYKNDDGPPGHESPYIYGLYRHLTQDLGRDLLRPETGL